MKRHRSTSKTQNYLLILEEIKSSLYERYTIHDFKRLFGMPSFSHLLESITSDEQQQDACRLILETMMGNLKLHKKPQIFEDSHVQCGTSNLSSSSSKHSNSITDKITIDYIMKLFVKLNDSISLNADQNDIQHLTQLVIYFLKKIKIDNPVEQLDFNSRCRASIPNLNPVLVYLVESTFELVLNRNKKMKREARQNLLNGCLAYGLITIPAISIPEIRLKLLREGCRIAHTKTCLCLENLYMNQISLNLDNDAFLA